MAATQYLVTNLRASELHCRTDTHRKRPHGVALDHRIDQGSLNNCAIVGEIGAVELQFQGVYVRPGAGVQNGVTRIVIVGVRDLVSTVRGTYDVVIDTDEA